MNLYTQTLSKLYGLQQFSIKMKGFDKDEVNHFLNQIAEMVEQEIIEREQLKKELAGLVSKRRPLPSLEIDRAMYDLSGNPETAFHAKKSLENALIKTSSALLSFLLVGEDSQITYFVENPF